MKTLGGPAFAPSTGPGTQENTTASVATLSLSVGPTVTITATLAKSQAGASCNGGGHASISGSSTITSLKINGSTVNVTGAANQVVNLPSSLGTITINEQTSNVTQPHAEIDVTALDVKAPGIQNAPHLAKPLRRHLRKKQ